MKRKSVGIGTMSVAGMCLLLSAGMTLAAGWSEDFSSDPFGSGGAWTASNNSSGSYARWTGNQLELRNNYDGSGARADRSLDSTITQASDMSISFDFNINYHYYNAQQLVGLTSSTGPSMIAFELQPQYWVWPDWDYFYIDFTDGAGSKSRYNTGVAVNFYDHHTYGVTMTYSAATKTLSFTMVDRNDGDAVEGAGSWSLAGSEFSVDRFSIFNPTSATGLLESSSGDLQTYYDNVTFVPEPATLSLLVLSAIGFLRKR